MSPGAIISTRDVFRDLHVFCRIEKASRWHAVISQLNYPKQKLARHRWKLGSFSSVKNSEMAEVMLKYFLPYVDRRVVRYSVYGYYTHTLTCPHFSAADPQPLTPFIMIDD